MSTAVSGTQVERFVAAALGRPVVRVERLAGSVANQDFVVELGDDSGVEVDDDSGVTHDALRVVVKVGPAAELVAEAWACRRLGRRGLTVPEVVHLDLVGAELGLPALVLGWVAGAPSEEPDVARAAGRTLREVHVLHYRGQGRVPGGLRPGWLRLGGYGLHGNGRDGYGQRLTPALEEKLARYRIAWNLRALSYEHRAGGTWFDTYRDRVREDTALLAP